ncbi:hypothetical protein [Schleiferilactobacillus shenzhenensis]|uniref:Uncharacterized protein n=1 Tax=Schleiferilactobacillus shenzhenensis LY-73 TaxID=1231336 RepID=U4TXB8_9LACO|nr:hypothetical protein [Schleiferilactobacillus shenzhenensis]ERL65992.1 hypothetical protein L248_2068 [Schleiferilactobacillus shenzhenensis LY-73]
MTLSTINPLTQQTPTPEPIIMMNSLDELVPVKDAVAFFQRVAKVQPASRLTLLPGNRYAQAYEDDVLD